MDKRSGTTSPCLWEPPAKSRLRNTKPEAVSESGQLGRNRNRHPLNHRGRTGHSGDGGLGHVSVHFGPRILRAGGSSPPPQPSATKWRPWVNRHPGTGRSRKRQRKQNPGSPTHSAPISSSTDRPLMNCVLPSRRHARSPRRLPPPAARAWPRAPRPLSALQAASAVHQLSAAVDAGGVVVTAAGAEEHLTPGGSMDVTVTVKNTGPTVLSQPSPRIDLPQGWSARPLSRFPETVEPAGEAHATFSVTAPAGTPPTTYPARGHVFVYARG